VTNDAGVVISTAAADRLSSGVLDVRNPGYTYTVTAATLSGVANMAQRGGTSARLQGPDGLDVDVTGKSEFPISGEGSYTYSVSANGLSRSANFSFSMPQPATAAGILNITPATVTASWPDRNLDGPYLLTAAEMPSWRIQNGDPAAALPQPLAWTRTDDGATGTAAVADMLYPGTHRITASFVPPNPNYSPAAVTSTWSITAPLTVSASHASLEVNGAPTASGTLLRILPGTTVSLAASPARDFDWGLDWTGDPATIWTGSEELLASPTSAVFAVKIPAGTGPLNLTASAFQVGPRVVAFSPAAASFLVPSGPAEGHSYPRSWNSSGTWYAYLGREGVTFEVVGQARESGISAFEIQAKPPGGEWLLLASGAPTADVPNGPRASVPQKFSVKLGDSNPIKPLVPLDPLLAGSWQIRARVQSTAGVWSPWTFEQPLNVVMPIQIVTKKGRTLPPVADADWYEASSLQAYTFKVLVP
jgi:hypothetical protein